MIEVTENFIKVANKLPKAPERVALYVGIIGIADAMYNIEFGNPIMGGFK